MDRSGYERVLAELARALTFGVNPSLDAITALCERMGRPQDAFETVQVGGTNGKTSTARFSAALLQAEGVSAGLYTSPHLERYPERIEVGGEVVSDEEFAVAVSAALSAAASIGLGPGGESGGATEFELLTAGALWLFRERAVEIAVLEVGMGGRWDATTVVMPKVAVVTGVGLDHMQVLGDTLEAIAVEKAAIIRPGVLAVIGPGTVGLDHVFLARADECGIELWAVRERGAPSPVPEERTVRFEVSACPSAPCGSTIVSVDAVLGRYDRLVLAAPAHQAANVATALAAAERVLGRSLDAGLVQEALRFAHLPGRFEVVRADPPIIVDGSHNPQAASVLAGALSEAFTAGRLRPVALIGVLADKDAEGIVKALAPAVDGFVVTQPDTPRSLSAPALAAIVSRVTGVAPIIEPDAHVAVTSLLSDPRGFVVTGSLTTAGQARRLIREASEHRSHAHEPKPRARGPFC